jgi:hypothetical protein
MKPWIVFVFTILLVSSCKPSKEEFPYPSLFWGFVVEGYPITQSKLDSLFAETAVHPDMIVFYLQWPNKDQKQESIKSSLEVIWENGAVPCITWEPMTINDEREKAIPYQNILNGSYDSYLKSFAEEIRSWGKPLVIRFAHEMNLSRYHWGTEIEEYGEKSPEIYKKLFRYIVAFFRKNKTTNVLWAFSPNAESIPNEPWNDVKNYYPGDEYVNLLGMDGYNWGSEEKAKKSSHKNWVSSFRSFQQIFKPLYVQLKLIAPKKPIIIFETASTERKGDPSKMEWLEDALETAREWGVKGIIWFQVNKEEDWRIISEANEKPFLKPEPPLQVWLTDFLRGA